MKFLAFILLAFSTIACADSKKVLPVSKDEVATKRAKIADEKIKALDKTEDCDEKAKKPVEIKPESISLGGNAGCSLDEAH